MEKQILIPEALFQRLQKHAVPFVDTPPMVIERMVDFFESHNGSQEAVETNGTPAPSPSDTIRKFSETRPPDLTHTRVHGEFAGLDFFKWSDLMQLSHRKALETVGSFEELTKVTRAQIRKGNYSANGFKPIPETGISLQGVDANHAWEHAFRLARFLKVPIRAVIEWRHNDKAAYPGEQGRLEWTPDES